MDIVPYLSAIILISTIATVLLALFSYAAFKLRDRRSRRRVADEQPVFFQRYPPDAGEAGEAESEAAP